MNSLNILVKGYKHLAVKSKVPQRNVIKNYKSPVSLNRHLTLSLARTYSTRAPYGEVYDELEDMDDYYDPSWDYEYPEEEGFADLTPEEFEELLKEYPNFRFPPGLYEQESNKFSTVPKANKFSTVPEVEESEPVVKEIKGNSILGNSPLDRLKVGTIRLPNELMERANLLLRGYPKAWLKRDAELVRELMQSRTKLKVNRKGVSPHGVVDEQKLIRFEEEHSPIQYNAHQSMAYVASHLPELYSSTSKVLNEIMQRFPDFKPKKMLDFGSGPGTAAWAASEAFPSLKRYLLVEPSDSMTDISTKLLDGFPVERRRFLHQGHKDSYDLIVSGYTLSELENDNSRRLHIRSLWEHLAPGGMFVFLEAGNPFGFKLIRQARTLLLSVGDEGALEPKIVAPCPHAYNCPMGTNSWCHFVQRAEHNPPFINANNFKNKNWKSTKYSYLIFSKGPANEIEVPEDNPNKGLKWSRLIRQPLKRGGHIIMDVCTPTGTSKRTIVSRKHGLEEYKAARKSTWGDMFYFDRITEQEDKPTRNWKKRLNDEEE